MELPQSTTTKRLEAKQSLNEWAKKKRAEQRAKEGFTVKKAQDIPRVIVEEMRQLHDELGMSFAKIGKIYNVSRYLVCSALSSSSSSSTTKCIKPVQSHI